MIHLCRPFPGSSLASLSYSNILRVLFLCVRNAFAEKHQSAQLRDGRLLQINPKEISCLNLASPTRGRFAAAFTCSLSADAPCPLSAGEACSRLLLSSKYGKLKNRVRQVSVGCAPGWSRAPSCADQRWAWACPAAVWRLPRRRCALPECVHAPMKVIFVGAGLQ